MEDQVKRTKIVCTLGPAVDSEDTLRRMILAGMDVARLNFSHGSHEEHLGRIERLKRVREQLDSPCALMLDTKGPEIRTGRLAGGAPVELHAGMAVELHEDMPEGSIGEDGVLRVGQSHAGLWSSVRPGDSILLDDGLIELRVSEAREGVVACQAMNGGLLGEKKSMNLPGIEVDLPALTEQDRSDLRFGVENDIDFVAASFVRSADDVRAIRAYLDEVGGADVMIVSKIECRHGVDNIEEIVDVSDGIMVARGDLGVEVPSAEVPHIQKRVIELANSKHTPVITATQMLDSMIRNPRPTRAEVADVANAIYDGTDAVMLSGETAAGSHPVEAVRMMAQIARASEPYLREPPADAVRYATPAERVSPTVGRAAVETAEAVGAVCVVTPTTSGRTARLISNLRPRVPIYAVTSRPRALHQMQLFWGVTPLIGEVENVSMRAVILNAQRTVVEEGIVSPHDIVVFTAGDDQTSPMLPPGAHGAGKSAPTNVMYVIEIPEELPEDPVAPFSN